MKPARAVVAGLWMLALLPPAAPADDEARLSFARGPEPAVELRLADLRARLTVHELEFPDPMYDGRNKRYLAFALADVLDRGFGTDWRDDEDYSDVALRASDGYEALAERRRLAEPGGYLVFADRDVPGWEPVGRRQANPGPFYVVWTGADQGTREGYPWPWQLAAIALLRFEDQYPAVYPQGASADSAAYQGFVLFRQRCLRCHAMSRQGGKVGPDLNEPRSIVSYRPVDMIRAFIHHPSEFRHTQMPDHRDLSARQLDQLIEYFWFMKDRSMAAETD